MITLRTYEHTGLITPGPDLMDIIARGHGGAAPYEIMQQAEDSDSELHAHFVALRDTAWALCEAYCRRTWRASGAVAEVEASEPGQWNWPYRPTPETLTAAWWNDTAAEYQDYTAGSFYYGAGRILLPVGLWKLTAEWERASTPAEVTEAVLRIARFLHVHTPRERDAVRSRTTGDETYAAWAPRMPEVVSRSGAADLLLHQARFT